MMSEATQLYHTEYVSNELKLKCLIFQARCVMFTNLRKKHGESAYNNMIYNICKYV